MENRIKKLDNDDFEVISEEMNEWLKENPAFAGPYEFARDREVEEKIANDNKNRKAGESQGSKSEDIKGSGKRYSYVPFREA